MVRPAGMTVKAKPIIIGAMKEDTSNSIESVVMGRGWLNTWMGSPFVMELKVNINIINIKKCILS